MSTPEKEVELSVVGNVNDPVRSEHLSHEEIMELSASGGPGHYVDIRFVGTHDSKGVIVSVSVDGKNLRSPEGNDLMFELGTKYGTKAPIELKVGIVMSDFIMKAMSMMTDDAIDSIDLTPKKMEEPNDDPETGQSDTVATADDANEAAGAGDDGEGTEESLGACDSADDTGD